MPIIKQHVASGPDRRVGRINADDGAVYRLYLGMDDYLGWVDYQEGRVYRHRRLAPDQEIGQVDKRTGRVYRERPGPDQYVGWVESGGRLYRPTAQGRDQHLGRVEGMTNVVEGAAALLFFFLGEHAASDTVPDEPGS